MEVGKKNENEDENKNKNEFEIRWFDAVGREERLCGHATLASAHVLFSLELVPKDKTITIYSRHSGSLYLSAKDDEYILNFPAKPALSDSKLTSDQVNRALDSVGLKKEQMIYIGDNGMDWLIEVTDEDIIPKITPNFAEIQQLKTRCLIVTSKSNGTKHRQQKVEYVNRVFLSTSEDPVTGSAHCFLACHWAKKLNIKQNTTFKGFQASRRGGIVSVALTEKDRCLLGGKAVTVMNVELLC